MDPKLLDLVWRHPSRSTRAIVDLDAIAANVAAVRKLIGNDVCLLAVVKANAYGHGAIAVAQTALAAGAGMLGVATVDEGVQLRAAGIEAPILALGPVDESEMALAIGRGIEMTVGDISFASAIVSTAEQLGMPGPVAVHLKIDTGMHRFGVTPSQAHELGAFIAGNRLLKLKGISSHFAQSDEEDEGPTEAQIAVLDGIVAHLQASGVNAQYVHSANSAALLRSRAYDRTMVRLGISLYGLDPSSSVTVLPSMRPAITLVSRVRRVFELESGDGVSYGATYRATSAERVALVPIGYADGYRRSLSNRGWMSVSGERCPVRGRVCMDQTMIGLPDSLQVEVGDTVVVGGALGDGSAPSVDQLAELVGTINYEIVTGFDRRIPRMFVRSGEVVAIEDLHGFRELLPRGHTNS